MEKREIDTIHNDLSLTESLFKLRKIKRTLIFAGIIVLAIISIIIFTWIAAGKRTAAKTADEISSLSEQIEKQKKTIKELQDNPIVLYPVAPKIELEKFSAELKEIGELATMEYIYTTSGLFSDSHELFNKIKIPFTTKSFTMKWDGTIKAGIDVTQITFTQDPENAVLTVFLPQSKILSHDPDRNSVEIFNERDGLFNRVRIDDQVSFDAAIEKEMEERAIENGLLEKAQENAEHIIFNLLNANPDINKYYAIQFELAKK